MANYLALKTMLKKPGNDGSNPSGTVMYYCEYCKRQFKNYQSFGGHKATCKYNPNYEYNIRGLKRYRKKVYSLYCKKCGKEYKLEVTEHSFKKGNYRKHCSRVCANSHIQTIEQNRSRSKKLTKNQKVKMSGICAYCGKVFEYECVAGKKRMYCSQRCSQLSANSYARKSEIKYKEKIESVLDTTSLIPQFVHGHWFDFVNNDYIIELTIDNTGGISNEIKRMNDISSTEMREKILICPSKYFGKVRRKRLRNIGVKFVDIAEIV